MDSTQEPEPTKSRGLMAVANDTVIEAANAAAGGLSSAANFIKPGNAVSGWIDKNIIQAGEESQSDVVKASKKKFREGVENADGVMGELGAVGSYIAENPLLAAAQAAGSFVGPGVAVKGAGMVGRAAGLGAKGIERAGRAGGVAAGAAMAGGDAAGTAYDLAIKAGATEEEATAAARQASVIPALVGGAGGAFGAEKLLAGAKGFGGNAAGRAAKTGLSEAAQEAVEEGVTQYEGQRAAVPFDPSIDPSKGVAAAAGMGAALGGMTGAGTSLFTGGHAAGQPAGNPLDEAINHRAAESGAPSRPLALPAPTITVDGTGVARTADDRNTVLQRSADGSFVDMTEVPRQAPLPDPEMLALPAPVIQVDGAGNAITSGDRNAQAQQDLEARAARRQRLDSGDILDVTPVPHSPGFVPPEPVPTPVVPVRGALSRAANLGAAASQQAAPAFPTLDAQNNDQPDVSAHRVDADTGEISAEARAGQIQEHLDFLSQMGRTQGWTNEALAQRTALQQELDLLSPAQRMADLNDQAAEAEARAADWAGRQYRTNPTELPEHAAKGGPADIQEANEQRRLKNIQQAQQEAAAARAQLDQVESEGNAQAQLAALEDRAARLAEAAPDILNKQGKPFTVKLPAVKAAQAAGAGWEPVKVDGGYVVRQVQNTDGPAPITPPSPKVEESAEQEATAKAVEIAREGNAQRQQVAQADQDAGARWDAMEPDAQRAVLAAVPKMAKVIRQSLEGKPWEKMSAGNREKVLVAMNSEAASAQQQKKYEEKPIPGEAPPKPAAQPVGDEKPFAAETGTLGIPRAEMPQVPTANHGGLVKHLNAQGIAHETTTVDAVQLKPTQAEYSPSKVEAAKSAAGDRAVIVSSDGHIIDGHHQAVAAAEEGKQVKAIVLHAPVEQALAAVKASPSATISAAPAPVSSQHDGEEAVFSTASAKPAKSMSVQEVQAIADRILEDLGVGAKVRLQTFGKASESGLRVPPSVIPMGATSNGKVYLFAESLSDPLEVFRVVVHEVFHLGLSKSVQQGAYIQKMLGFLTDPTVRKYAERWKRTADGLSRKASMPVNNWQALAVEESLSDLAEELVAERDGIGSKPMVDWARRMASRLARWADGLGLKGVGQRIRAMTQTEVEQFIVQTLARADSDAPALLRGGRFSSAPVDQQVANESAKLEQESKPIPSFRRQEAEQLASAAFDVASFLQAMNDGQPMTEARAQAVSAVQKTVDAIRAGWANGPEVTVVYDMADPAIPAAARRADQAQRSGGADGDPEGFYYGGKAYLLASQLHTDKDVARVLMHEALGHHGLRGVFGTGLDSVLEQIVAVRRGDVRRKAAEYGLDYDKPAHRLQAAEEVLAEWAQSRPEMGFVRRAVAAIRSWLRQHVPGFNKMRVTDEEIIRAYILPARGWVERGAGAGQQNVPSFSRSTRPELDTFPAEFMAELSQVDELYAYPMVHAGSAEAALRQVDPSIKFVGDVTAMDERQESGADTKLLFRTGNGRDFFVFEKGDDFWLDVSRLDEGGGGNAIYSALMDYAASDNKVFIGDPAGLSDIAMRRRLEAMLSSAIKHGSTDHMQPHARQVRGDEKLGIPALKWKQGDTIGNVQRMIDVSLASISAHVPEFRRARYDFKTGTFRNSQGAPLSDEVLRGWASKFDRVRAAGAGERTLKRGILLNTLLRAEGGQRSGLLEQALRQPGQLVGPQAQGIFYSRSASDSVIPDAIIGSTLGTASSHPDYAAAKAGDIEAAFRLAQDIVTPELVAKVRAAIGDTKPVVVPVAAEEATGRNRIPVAAAGVLAQRLGLSTSGAIVQANRAHRTGMDGLDRIFAPVDFAGKVEAKPYLLVDDTLTQGGTFAALASHIREGGGTVAGVIALTGKQYSAKIQPSAESLASLRQKHGDLESEFRAATGYGFDSLTESEARYLARYEPADRLRDRISAEGHRGRAGEDQGNAGQGSLEDGPLFSRSRLADIKDSALTQLDSILSHPGKVSMWDKTVGTMRHLAERNPFFKPVYESAQQNIDDVSMLANDAADQAPRILPRVDSMGDILGKNRKRPVSAADNKAVARPLFEGTLLWARDINGQATLVEDLTKKYANLGVHNKAAMLLKANRIDAGVLAMWQGLPAQQYEKLIDSRFESKILKAGVVWSDKELQSQFGATPDQISLYREARAAIDRSIDMTARADMMRTLGDEYAAMRDAVLEQPSMDSAAQLLLDTLEQDSKANPDNRDRLAGMQRDVRLRLDMATDLQHAGYAPLSRFGRYTVDVVDAAGERQYFGMYETIREANTAARDFRLTFPGAKVEQGTMTEKTFKLFAGVTPETLEQFGEMLGLKSQGNEAQDKAFQEYLKITKNNHSALKRLIHRKGTAGYSQDVGRVVANFVYSNARAGAQGLNAGQMEKAIAAIPQQQGELRDLAMGLRSYIQDPQEEGQAVRGMLFAQYLGGSLASAFVNMTQPFQVTLPWLSQYGGMKKAGAQLARALKDMGTKGFQYEADLAKALQSAEDDGVVSPQEIHQLMAQARGAGALRAGDGTAAGDARATAANAWERTKVAWGQPFALAEQFNRRSTFIASYRLAKEQGIQNPSAFARKAVLDTQFVYSKAVKPQWARGTIGGTLFTFKTYSVSYLELMQRMWTQGGKEGKRAVGWSIAMLMLMGGAGGLPFAEDVEDLIDAGGQLMGYSMSVKQWRKQLMQDVLGKDLAEFIEQGVSGLPGAPIDISGRLGMGNLIPGTGLFLEKRDHSRDLVEIIGPAGDLIQRAATGARKALTGDIAGAALEVSPTAVRNAAKGLDMADSGVYKDSKGRKVIDVTLGEAVAKAVGFQPKSVAETQEATATEQNLIGQNRAMKERLTADMAQAVYDKDGDKQGEIRERMRNWNRRNPESPLTIDMLAVRRRVIKMRQTKAERVAAAAPKSIRASVRQSLAEAQGGATAP
ncbi:PLxRFG domain-containing protein [Comamonas sp. Tr-654]|uniref:PLxRFG domain-containing protein n=1 Tax=Comamonas sp. Tr-654 TaxID=2608341 RepID=UPI001422D362|nr:PLxRFG domain-containing protein [Comamonas sp. Tr-654]